MFPIVVVGEMYFFIMDSLLWLEAMAVESVFSFCSEYRESFFWFDKDVKKIVKDLSKS